LEQGGKVGGVTLVLRTFPKLKVKEGHRKVGRNSLFYISQYNKHNLVSVDMEVTKGWTDETTYPSTPKF